MKIAAYQAPLAACPSLDQSLALICEQIDACESKGVEVLCCPEGVLGGLADYTCDPAAIAIDAEGGQLQRMLLPMTSTSVTTILGFTEIDRFGRLYNAAAVFSRGVVVGVYRKLHPARRRSVYAAGESMPTFSIDRLTFGIVICRDSTFAEPARVMAARGAAILFVPTNNGLPPTIDGRVVIEETRACDIALARQHRVWVVRADVAGRTAQLASHGSSGIVDPEGTLLASGGEFDAGLVVADIRVWN